MRSTFNCCTVLILGVLTSFCWRPADAEIPLKLAKKLTHVTSNEEFVRLYVFQDPLTTHASSTSNGRRALLKSSQDTPAAFSENIATKSVLPQEECEPRNTVVPIPPDPDPAVFYWPTCVSVPRCGGCCVHSALACVPTARSNVSVQVIKTILVAPSEDHLQFVSYVEIPIETHTSCACQCRVQASDCNNLLQNYDPDSCQCLCRNVTTCVTPKHWDQTSCSCVCPIIFNCLDDEYFNYSTCSCRRFVNIQPLQPYDGSSNPTSLTASRPTSLKTPCSDVDCRPGYKPVTLFDQCICLPYTGSENVRKRSSLPQNLNKRDRDKFTT